MRGEICGRHPRHAPLSVVRLIVEFFFFLSIPLLHTTQAVTASRCCAVQGGLWYCVSAARTVPDVSQRCRQCSAEKHGYIMMIIMITLRGAFRYFYNLLTAPANCLQHVHSLPRRNRVQITCNTLSAYHVQHIVCHVVRRDSSAIKFDRVQIAFILALFY